MGADVCICGRDTRSSSGNVDHGGEGRRDRQLANGEGGWKGHVSYGVETLCHGPRLRHCVFMCLETITRNMRERERESNESNRDK